MSTDTGSDVERHTTGRISDNIFIVTSLGFSLRFCVKIIMPVSCVCVLEVRRTKHPAGLTRTGRSTQSVRLRKESISGKEQRDERYPHAGSVMLPEWPLDPAFRL